LTPDIEPVALLKDVTPVFVVVVFPPALDIEIPVPPVNV
jgi:hypothetical protein